MSSTRDRDPFTELRTLQTPSSAKPLAFILTAMLRPELYTNESRFKHLLQVKLKATTHGDLSPLHEPLNALFTMLAPIFQNEATYKEHPFYTQLSNYIMTLSVTEQREPLDPEDLELMQSTEAELYSMKVNFAKYQPVDPKTQVTNLQNDNFVYYEAHYKVYSISAEIFSDLGIKVSEFKVTSEEERAKVEVLQDKLSAFYIEAIKNQYATVEAMVDICWGPPIDTLLISEIELSQLKDYALILRHQLNRLSFGLDKATKHRLLDVFMDKVVTIEMALRFMDGYLDQSFFDSNTLNPYRKYGGRDFDPTLRGYTLSEDLPQVKADLKQWTTNIRQILVSLNHRIQDRVYIYINYAELDVASSLLYAQKARLPKVKIFSEPIEKALAQLSLIPSILHPDSIGQDRLLMRMNFLDYYSKALDRLSELYQQEPQSFVDWDLREQLDVAYEHALRYLLLAFTFTVSESPDFPLSPTKCAYYSKVCHQQQLILSYKILTQLPYIGKFTLYSLHLQKLIQDLASPESYAAYAKTCQSYKLMDILLDAIHADELAIAAFNLKACRKSSSLDPVLIASTEASYQKFCEQLKVEETAFNQKMTKAFANRRKHEKTRPEPKRSAQPNLFQPAPSLRPEKTPQALAEIDGALCLQRRVFDQAIVAYTRCQTLAREVNDHKYIAAGMLGISETYKMLALAATPSNFATPTEEKSFEKMRGYYGQAKDYAQQALAYFTQELAPQMDEIDASMDQELEHLSCAIHLCLFNAENNVNFVREKNAARVEFLGSQYERMVKERNEIRARMGEEAWKHRDKPKSEFTELRERTLEQRDQLSELGKDLDGLSEELRPLVAKFAVLAGKSSARLGASQLQIEAEVLVPAPFRERLAELAKPEGRLRLMA